MSLAIVYSRALNGIEAPLVTIESHLTSGLPAFSIVGLPELAVRESKDRVRAAILNSRFEFPNKRITVNLAPANLPKEGGHFDLPIAISILAAAGQLSKALLNHIELAGELSLSGELRNIHGSLPMAIASGDAKHEFIVPAQIAQEAALAEQTFVYGASSLLEVCAMLNGEATLHRIERTTEAIIQNQAACLSDVKGQHHAKRALEIAAAGGHNMLMVGPPGAGKTMLAKRLPGLLPDMSEQEAIQTAAIHSISGKSFSIDTWKQRPYRAPHHTASGVALIGGGSSPRPGEISLAHNGVLFLDELTEYERKVLDVLREPMEAGQITISRAARQADFPANFQLIAAMNPCQCGYLNDPKRACGSCSIEQVRRYQAKVSGPLLDRIDLQLIVPALPKEALQQTQADGESSATIRQRVADCRQRQLQRSSDINAKLNNKALETICQLSTQAQGLLNNVMDKLQLSARGYHRILRVARTIADLAEQELIETGHISEAVSYRMLDRTLG